MKSQKSDNDGNSAKAPVSQAPKAKVVARTTKPKVEKKENPKSSAPSIGRKKVVETLQSQSDPEHTSFPAEEELQASVAKRAYELYEYRGWQHGDDQADWFQAKKEVLSQHGVR